MSAQVQQNSFRAQVEVTNAFVACYYKSIKGQQKLAELLEGLNSNTRIEENPADSSRPIVIINADSEENAERTKMKISQALFHLSFRSSFTHLVSVPFTNEGFVSSYLQFKDKVLSTFDQCQGIDESLFQNPKKLHLTISVLTLITEDHINKAKDILDNECRQISSMDLGRKMSVKGVGIMNENPSQTNVLYAKVEDSMLQEVANKIAQRMVSDGLVFNDPHKSTSVKLHITLMNTVLARRKFMKFRKRKANGGLNLIKHFDSGRILDYYNDFTFADIDLPPIQLNDVHSVDEHGYYKAVHSVQLGNGQNNTAIT